MYRSIVALDIERSTERSDLEKAELRRALYDFVGQALVAAGIKEEHLEQISDRGDGMLILIRPHDDVPKTALLNKLIPELASLLDSYNSSPARTEGPLRVRAVVHAGEVNYDGKGFFGGALDIAFRLLESPRLKSLLKEATGSSLILVVSQEIYSGTICQGHVDKNGYKPLGRRIAGRSHRGWVHVPTPYGVTSGDESPPDNRNDEPELSHRSGPAPWRRRRGSTTREGEAATRRTVRSLTSGRQVVSVPSNSIFWGNGEASSRVPG